VRIEVVPIDTDNTTYDRDAREPVKQVARKEPKRPRAQVQWSKKQEPSPGRAGTGERSAGYFIFDVRELAQLRYTPRRGDRITVIGRQTGLDLYLTTSEPCGHYDGENWLLRFEFEDRQPTRRP
jgi:hypothetical protein